MDLLTEFRDLPQAEAKFIRFLLYIGGNALGGLFSPAVYIFLLWWTWKCLEARGAVILIFSGLILSAAVITYPLAVSLSRKRRIEDVRRARDAFSHVMGLWTSPVQRELETNAIRGRLNTLGDALTRLQNGLEDKKEYPTIN